MKVNNKFMSFKQKKLFYLFNKRAKHFVHQTIIRPSLYKIYNTLHVVQITFNVVSDPINLIPLLNSTRKKCNYWVVILPVIYYEMLWRAEMKLKLILSHNKIYLSCHKSQLVAYVARHRVRIFFSFTPNPLWFL